MVVVDSVCKEIEEASSGSATLLSLLNDKVECISEGQRYDDCAAPLATSNMANESCRISGNICT
jgi:hypothetical protein